MGREGERKIARIQSISGETHIRRKNRDSPIAMFMFALTLATASVLEVAEGQSSVNTPPVIWLNRNWILTDSEPPGSIVTRVRAEDNEQEDLIYGLEPIEHGFNGGDPKSPLPFSIDNKTGTIYINETLKGRGGQNLLLYVTVSDGQLTAKTEVFVNINSSNKNKGNNTRISGRIRPPIIHLPSLTVSPALPSTNTRTRLHPDNVSTGDNNDNYSYLPKTPNVEDKTDVPSVTPEVNHSEIQPSFPLALVPIAAVCALFLGIAMGIWSFRTRYCTNRKSQEAVKGQVSVSIMNGSDDPSLVVNHLGGKKLYGDKFDSWSNVGQQVSYSKSCDEKWEFPRHRLKVFNILGEGCFGQVWKCEALNIDGNPGATIVAVKTLKENASEREKLDLEHELKIMKGLEPHPNVVRLLGCCTERQPMFVILEYVSGGKLQSYLRATREDKSNGGSSLTSRDLTGYVYQVAKGMEHLASKGIIHRDLAARNVLITENRVCKVADFGFARDVTTRLIYERKSEGRLPIRWMAPESLYDNIFSTKSDVWSFGVLIWEIVTLGSTPYPGIAAADVMRRIKDGYRLDRPEHCKRELYNIMYYCWDKDPTLRPSFTELVSLTEGLLLDETDYIELDRFPDHSYYNVLHLSGEKV